MAPCRSRHLPPRGAAGRNRIVARQLIAAAERLVAERGYLAVRLEDIGAAAGVSGPAIYRHFPNKEALLVELLVGHQYPAAGRRHRRRRAAPTTLQMRWTGSSTSTWTSHSANQT